MAKPTSPNDVSDTLAAPLGDLIAAVGRGLAEAQQALDLATVETIKALQAGQSASLDVLRQLGYQPTWYRIPELHAEITLSLSIGSSTTTSGTGSADAQGQGGQTGPGRIRLYGSTMDASYTNRYDYDLNAASVIKFRIVPVPPSTAAADLKVVPRLDRMLFKDARARLVSLGIPFDVPAPPPRDDEVVQGTDPAAGEFLPLGQRVTLSFDRAAP
jgi:hypothetical protein